MTLIESIYNDPHSWRPTEFYFIHTSGARLWIANGWLFCKPPNGHLGMINRWRAWRAYKCWCMTAPVERFGITREQ